MYLNTSSTVFSQVSLNGAIDCFQSDINCEKNVQAMLKQQIEEEVRNVRNSLCCLLAIVLCVAIVLLYQI